MNFLRQGFRKLSSDRHTYIQTDTTKVIYHAASRVWSINRMVMVVTGFISILLLMMMMVVMVMVMVVVVVVLVVLVVMVMVVVMVVVVMCCACAVLYVAGRHSAVALRVPR